MYNAFFSLNVKPFDLLPNPDFLYLSRSHNKAVTYLDHAVRNRSGFVLLSGEIGSGKTTVIRDLFNKYHQKIVFSKVSNTKVDFEQLLAMINEDFGLPVTTTGKVALLRELNDFLINQYAQGHQTILIIDEAQNLPPETLEEIRLLSNLETDNAKLLQIVLAGQPELRKMLALPKLQQLRQRISCFCHILPLEQDEIEPYLLHRLECAGNRQAVEFSSESLRIILRYTRGIPRLINIFCDYLLLLSFSEGVRIISPELAEAVASDLDFENCYWGVTAVQSEGLPVKNKLPPAQVNISARSTHDNSVEEILSEILKRVGPLQAINPRDLGASENLAISSIGQNHTVRHPKNHFASNGQPHDAFRNEVEPHTPHSPPRIKQEKKKWLGFLFRAA